MNRSVSGKTKSEGRGVKTTNPHEREAWDVRESVVDTLWDESISRVSSRRLGSSVDAVDAGCRRGSGGRSGKLGDAGGNGSGRRRELAKENDPGKGKDG